MASPTVYKWTDTGAPQVKEGQMEDYKALFQAVLIDGYGSKQPPVSGLNKWSIPHSDGTGFVLKQGGTPSRKCCIKLSNFYSSGGFAEMQCAVDYTDMNTPVIPWAGSTSNHRVGVGNTNNSTYNIPWIIIATERSMFVQFGRNYTSENVTILDTNTYNFEMENYHWFFGDYVPEVPELEVNQCVSATNQSSTSGEYYCHSLTHSNTDGYGYKRCAGNVANISSEYDCIPMYTRSMISNNHPGDNDNYEYNPRYPNALNGGLYLDKVKILSDRNIVGEFPGLLFPIQTRPFPCNGVVYEFDGAGDYSGSTIYVFNTYDGQYMVHTGEWGVE